MTGWDDSPETNFLGDKIAPDRRAFNGVGTGSRTSFFRRQRGPNLNVALGVAKHLDSHRADRLLRDFSGGA